MNMKQTESISTTGRANERKIRTERSEKGVITKECDLENHFRDKTKAKTSKNETV